MAELNIDYLISRIQAEAGAIYGLTTNGSLQDFREAYDVNLPELRDLVDKLDVAIDQGPYSEKKQL